MPIIISRDGKSARRIDVSVMESEGFLQTYIAKNPEALLASLPFDDIQDNLKLMPIGTEFPSRSGERIDVLAIDNQGNIYIVETKLFKNPDKRRVVAQVLDYGAFLWKKYGGDPSGFIAAIEEHLDESLGVALPNFFGLEASEAIICIDQIKNNIKKGEFQFVVLMDELHDALRDLINFLNQKCEIAIYAVEMEFYRDEGLEIVIPKVFGAESRKKARENSGYAVFIELLHQPITRKDLIAGMVAKGFTESTAASYITWSKRPVDDTGMNPFGFQTEDYKDGEIKYLRKKEVSPQA